MERLEELINFESAPVFQYLGTDECGGDLMKLVGTYDLNRIKFRRDIGDGHYAIQHPKFSSIYLGIKQNLQGEIVLDEYAQSTLASIADEELRRKLGISSMVH